LKPVIDLAIRVDEVADVDDHDPASPAQVSGGIDTRDPRVPARQHTIAS